MATLKKYTMKLDRISNNELQLGLTTGLKLTANTDSLNVNKPVLLTQQPNWESASALTLTTKGYVDGIKTALDTDIDQAVANHIYAGERITIRPSSDGSTSRTISLSDLYDQSIEFDATKDQYGGTGYVVSAVVVDKYGTVTGIKTKKISTADLEMGGEGQQVFDNYEAWKLQIGDTTSLIKSINAKDKDGAAIDTTLKFSGGDGVTPTLSGTVVTFNLNINTDYLELANGKLGHKEIYTAENTAGLYKFATDKAGHVKSVEAATKTDLTNLIGAFTGSELGLVKGTDGNTATATPSVTQFYTSEGKWATIPFNNVMISQSTETQAIPVLISHAADSTSVKNAATVTVTPSTGTLTANKLIGSGEGITNINASNITSGTIPADRLPTIGAANIGLDLEGNTGAVLFSKGTGFGYANLTPTTTTQGYYFLGKNLTTTNSAAVAAEPAYYNLSDVVGEYLNELDALVLKGTVGSVTNDGATIETVDTLTGFKAGWRYIVVTNGTYAGQACEVGDILTAIKDHDSSYTSSTASDYWLVTQANINGAVTMAADSLASGRIMISSGGKTIESSAYSFTDGTLNANAQSASKLVAPITLWGQSFDGSANITGALSDVTTISTSQDATYDIGSSDKKFKTIYASRFEGVAAEAAKTSGTLKIAGSEFNGSTDVEITLSSLGGIGNVTTSESATSSGSFISGIEVQEKTEDGKVVKELVLTKSPAIKNVSSSIFNITTENESATIEFLTSTKAGAFSRTGSSDLVYTGNLSASKLYALNANNQSKEVALLKAGTVSDTNTLLVASQSATSVNDYDFVMSSYKVATATSMGTSTTNWDSETFIPTANAISKKVSTLIATSESGNIKMARYAMPTNDGTYATSIKIPSDSIVRRIAVDITSAFSSGATLQILVGTEEYVGTQDILATETGLYIFEYYNRVLSDSIMQITVSGSTASATPAGSIIIEYADPIE